MAQARAILAAAPWEDGRLTAGEQSAHAKNNEQLREDCDETRQVQQLLLRGLERHAVFFSAALPKQISPPLFNRYGGAANSFGNHVDSAVRFLRDGSGRVRTDISCTVFLSDPTTTTAASWSSRTPSASSGSSSRPATWCSIRAPACTGCCP